MNEHVGTDDRPPILFSHTDVPVDQTALSAGIRSAVAEVVHRQADADLDVVNDNEVSKPSDATSIKDRLHGFGGTSRPLQYRDLADSPELARRSSVTQCIIAARWHSIGR